MFLLNRSSSLLGIAASLVVSLAGCTLCQNCGDLDYPTYGGAWQRTIRDSGRVGSAFDPAGARTATLSARNSDAKDASLRSPSSGTGESVDDDPKGRDGDADKKSDDSRGKKKDDKKTPDNLRDLNLEDIDVQYDDLEPPDV